MSKQTGGSSAMAKLTSAEESREPEVFAAIVPWTRRAMTVTAATGIANRIYNASGSKGSTGLKTPVFVMFLLKSNRTRASTTSKFCRLSKFI